MKKLLPALLLLLLPLQAFAAIAPDAVSSNTDFGNPTGTTLTTVHTMGTVSNGVLITCVYFFKNPGPANVLTNVTDNGVNMTLATTSNHDNISQLWMYYKLNPPAGSNSIVATVSSAGAFEFEMVNSSYSGASQISFPDAKNNGAANTASGPITGTVTTTADNAWPVMCGHADDNTISSGSGTTLRISDPHYGRLGIGDLNAPKSPAGLATLNFNTSAATAQETWTTLSMAPAAAAATTPPPLWPFFFLSIGPVIPRKRKALLEGDFDTYEY